MKKEKAPIMTVDAVRRCLQHHGASLRIETSVLDTAHIEMAMNGRGRIVLDIGQQAPQAYQKLVTCLQKEHIDVIVTSTRDGQRSPAVSSHKIVLADVRHRLAVTCAKGGVGKSTTAVNLAVAFQARGLKVALLDADIYGPSLPMMMGLNAQLARAASGKIQPLYRYGIACMSIGFMTNTRDEALIWRGPMVMSALQQMLRDVEWGYADVLIIDMPPGTGDAQLTLAQRLELSGAILVSTPQDVALIDARKGFHMLQRVGITVLGIVNNMSHFVCPHCRQKTALFGDKGVRQQAAQMGIDVLGDIPLSVPLRESGDKGVPIVIAQPASDEAKTYRQIAESLWQRLERQTAAAKT